MISKILGFATSKFTLIGGIGLGIAILGVFTLCELKTSELEKANLEVAQAKEILVKLRKEIKVNQEICERGKNFTTFKEETREEVKNFLKEEHQESFNILSTEGKK